jgi:hypothetical protein
LRLRFFTLVLSHLLRSSPTTTTRCWRWNDRFSSLVEPRYLDGQSANRLLPNHLPAALETVLKHSSCRWFLSAPIPSGTLEALVAAAQGGSWEHGYVLDVLHDAAIAGQSAAIAIKSLGLRICYVGAVRNNAQQMCELLKLPPNVVRLFGVAVGYANTEGYSDIKPRLPVREVCHYEVWSEENQYVDVAPLTNRLVPFTLSNSSLVARVAVSL